MNAPAAGPVNPDPPRRARRDVDGIVLLDKPLHLSSNQALQRVKWLFQARKAGHTGSLDPLATGMLPICLGEATKVSAYLLDSDKVYRVRMSLGRQTATGDAEGPVIATGPESLGPEELERALVPFRGAILQVPPMYSALKQQGRRLYELAREGREVARAARAVHIHELSVESCGAPGPTLRVRCSKGTYIRSLVEDIARAAGTVAHVAELRRLAVTPFAEGAMHTLPQLEEAAESGLEALSCSLLATDEALPGWPQVSLAAIEAARISRGQPVTAMPAPPTGMVRLYGDRARFLGIGECLADGRIVPRRLMAAPGSPDTR